MLRQNPLPIDDNPHGPRLVLTESVVAAINMHLPKFVSGEHHENVLYIAGHAGVGRSVGCTVIAPEAETTWGNYSTSRGSHSAVMDFLADYKLAVVAQVHCHPGFEVYHSDGDDELAFLHAEDFWSLVVPHYGRSGTLPASNLGVHCYSAGCFRLLSPRAVDRRLIVAPNFADLRPTNGGGNP